MGPNPNGPLIRKLRSSYYCRYSGFFRGPFVDRGSVRWRFLGLFLFSKVGPFRHYPKFPGEAAFPFRGSHDIREQQENQPRIAGWVSGRFREGFSRKCLRDTPQKFFDVLDLLKEAIDMVLFPRKESKSHSNSNHIFGIFHPPKQVWAFFHKWFWKGDCFLFYTS